jgi:hypothetical protein
VRALVRDAVWFFVGAAIMGVLGVLSCTTACTPQARSAVTDVMLDATQIACIFRSEITDDASVAKICNIAPKLLPLIRELVSQREAAKRAGYRWQLPVDGGVPDGGDGGPEHP